jgi:general secretion pathway protein K
MLKNGCLLISTVIPKMKHFQQGVALIQILLLTGILSVLALYVTQTANSQITQAKWADEKAKAEVALHSAESALLFELFTQKKVNSQYSENKDANTISERWNFYAVPFNIHDNVVVKIQDQSGLIQLHYPDVSLLKKLVATIEPSQNNVNVVVDHILDWQDIDNVQRLNGGEMEDYANGLGIRNGAVPSIYDIKHVRSMSPAIRELLLTNTTIYQSGAFSLVNAAPDILRIIAGDNAAQQIIALRDNHQMSNATFREVSGLTEQEDSYYYTSNYLMIDLTSKLGQATAQKKMYIHLQPYAEDNAQPINIYKSW